MEGHRPSTWARRGEKGLPQTFRFIRRFRWSRFPAVPQGRATRFLVPLSGGIPTFRAIRPIEDDRLQWAVGRPVVLSACGRKRQGFSRSPAGRAFAVDGRRRQEETCAAPNPPGSPTIQTKLRRWAAGGRQIRPHARLRFGSRRKRLEQVLFRCPFAHRPTTAKLGREMDNGELRTRRMLLDIVNSELFANDPFVLIDVGLRVGARSRPCGSSARRLAAHALSTRRWWEVERFGARGGEPAGPLSRCASSDYLTTIPSPKRSP